MKPHPQALPNAENATISDDKFTKYVLNLGSERGRHKDLVFQSALGYNLTNYEPLGEQLKIGGAKYPDVPGPLDGHGQRYTVDIPVKGPDGGALVTPGWIVRPGSDVPDFVSAYVKKVKGKRDV